MYYTLIQTIVQKLRY